MDKKTAALAVVQTTVATATAARRLARRVLEARLAACVQCVPIRSVYRWKGKMESARECLLLMKTRKSLAAKTIAFVRAWHPYEVPEIVVTPVINSHPPYAAWVYKETGAVHRPDR